MGTVLYLGTRNGVLTVAENGGGWAIANHDLKGWEVTDVEPAPDNPRHVVAGTRGDGVWRSEDAGAHWFKPSYGRVAPGKVRCVTHDPHDPQTIYAGGEPISMWKSADGGASWTEIESVRNFPSIAGIGYPVPIVEPHVRDITVAPDDPNTIYAALQVGYMLKTTDGGATWRLLDNGLDEDVHAIIADPRDANRLYISSGGEGMRSGKAPGRSLYRSLDGGESWLPIALEFQNEYSVSFAYDPSDPSVMYSAVANGNPGQWRARESGAEATLIRSRDAGATWHELNADEEVVRGFPEAIAVDPQSLGRVFLATRSGRLFTSDDSGDTWADLGVTTPDVANMKIAHV